VVGGSAVMAKPRYDIKEELIQIMESREEIKSGIFTFLANKYGVSKQRIKQVAKKVNFPRITSQGLATFIKCGHPNVKENRIESFHKNGTISAVKCKICQRAQHKEKVGPNKSALIRNDLIDILVHNPERFKIGLYRELEIKYDIINAAGQVARQLKLPALVSRKGDLTFKICGHSRAEDNRIYLNGKKAFICKICHYQRNSINQYRRKSDLVDQEPDMIIRLEKLHEM
jgi:transcription elongation factor Elf1